MRYPILCGVFPSYYAAWLVAALVCIGGGTVVARRDVFFRRRVALALFLCALAILVGSKTLYLIEAAFFPSDDYVPMEIRGSLHGFRIPGGVVMLAATMPIICRLLGLEWRRFGDEFIMFAAVALLFIRLGCLLNGCCFGKVSSVPWAVTFPRGSWVYWYHRAESWTPPTAPVSLPVHPLQIYFFLAALLMFAAVLWKRRRTPYYTGSVQCLFYLLFFASTALLEPFRENYLTLNKWLAPIATAIFGGLLVGQNWRTKMAAGAAEIAQ